MTRQLEDRNELFEPTVPNPHRLIVNEGSALIQNYDAPNRQQYEELLVVPTKDISRLETLKTILDHIEELKDQHIDVLLVVTFVSMARNIITRNGRLIQCRSFEAMDGSINSPISFTLWENEWIVRASSWKPKETVLFLADARVAFDNFRKKPVISIGRKTLIIENPNVPQTMLVRISLEYYDRDTISTNPFVTPNPNTIMKVMTIHEISEKLNTRTTDCNGERMQFTAILRATITDMNVDKAGNDLISTKCALCKRPILEGQDSCMNLDCPSGNGNRAPFNTISMNIKVNLKDNTGYLIGCRLNDDAAECALSCTAAEFQGYVKFQLLQIKLRELFSKMHFLGLRRPEVRALSAKRRNSICKYHKIPKHIVHNLQSMTPLERADLKWKYILETCEIRLHIIGPTDAFPRALYNILAINSIQDEVQAE